MSESATEKRVVGRRPQKTVEEVCGTFSVRVPGRVREALVERARRGNVSLGEAVARVLEEAGA